MSARDLLTPETPAAEAVAQCCGTCGNSVQWRNGFVKCGLRPVYELLPGTKGCHFSPSRWVDDPLRREAMAIIEICSLDARRSYLERIDLERGKVAGANLREMVKRVWKERKLAAELVVTRE